jgi:chemotaxis protein MotB
MAKREKKPKPLPFPKDPGASLFLELMMQMLAFFILLTTFAVIVDEKRMAAMGSLAGTFNPMPFGANVAKGEGPAMPARDIVDGAAAPKRTAKKLTKIAEELGGKNAMQVIPLAKDSVRIRLAGNIVFAPGHVDLSPQALIYLDRLAIILQQPAVIEVNIAGHTDASPPQGSIYPSNWELSAARAMSVFHALTKRGVSRGRMIAAGMGDKQPVQGHPELSRRVDITLKFRPVTDEEGTRSKGNISTPQRPATARPGKAF